MTINTDSDLSDLYVSYNTSNTVVHSSKRSDWVCYLFGGNFVNGLSWTPEKGKEPNWFWRWMQYFFFGNKWEKLNKSFDKDNKI